MTDRFWTRFFALVGIINLLVGVPLVIDPGMTGATPFPVPAGDWLYPRIAGASIAAFGIGYLMVAYDLDRNRGIVLLGAIGKILVFLIVLIYAIKGSLGTWPVLAGFVDLALALAFIAFLRRYAERG